MITEIIFKTLFIDLMPDSCKTEKSASNKKMSTSNHYRKRGGLAGSDCTATFEAAMEPDRQQHPAKDILGQHTFGGDINITGQSFMAPDAC